MKKDFAGAFVPPEEFARLLRLCEHDRAFPRTYDAWCELVREGEELARRVGQSVEPVQVNLEFFEQWCQLTQVQPCLQALRAMLIINREGAHQGIRSLAPAAAAQSEAAG